MTIYGVHLLVLQAGAVTKEHKERPTRHCGLLFALRGRAGIRIDGAFYGMKPGKMVHCAYGKKLEIEVGEEEFEGLLIQYLPGQGEEALAGLRHMPRSFELEPGADEELFEQLRKLCLLSRQSVPASASKLGELQRRILGLTFRLSRLEPKAAAGADDGGGTADVAVDALADLFNKTAFVVEDVMRLSILPGQRLERYRLPKSGFLFVVRGEARMSFRDGDYRLEPGALCHGSEGQRMTLVPVGAESFEYYVVHYRFCEEGNAAADGTPGHFTLRPGPQPRLLELLERLHHTAVMPGKLTSFRKKELFLSVLGETFAACQSVRFGPGQLEAVERAVGYIHVHYAEPLTLEELARLQGMSVRQFSYLFHKNIGIRPIDYVIQYRIGRAREILAMSRTPIGEIAAMVGYDDPQYFSRVFRRHTGLSPREARMLTQPNAGVDNHPSFLE
ncbi:helix-turn-helix domain-containing protein [Cohnella cellulosilytica]